MMDRTIMIDRAMRQTKMTFIASEDRALLRSNPSAARDAGTGADACLQQTRRPPPLNLSWPQCAKPEAGTARLLHSAVGHMARSEGRQMTRRKTANPLRLRPDQHFN